MVLSDIIREIAIFKLLNPTQIVKISAFHEQESHLAGFVLVH